MLKFVMNAGAALLLIGGGVSFAAGTRPMPANAAAASAAPAHAKPCKAILQACKRAGKKGHDEVHGCMQTIRKGGKVAGVMVTPEQIRECQQDKGKNKKAR